jgi:UTP--glucose-1-phosphate uridylyltransferase
MLPVTASIQKELLPILDRPVIDYVVSDCVAAGITNIIFVIRPGSRGLQDYYVGNPVLEAHLKKFNKREALAKLKSTHTQATFSFVEQPSGAGYGTAVPLIVAMPHLPKGEAVLVCGGDDFLWRTDGGSDFASLVDEFHKTGSAGAITALERPSQELYRYGVLEIRVENRAEYLEKIIEKPAPGAEPSNLINISKYIISPEIMPYVTKVEPDPASGELYITDAIQAAAAGHHILVHRAKGAFLDSGSLTGWLEANIMVAKSRPDLAPAAGSVELDR